MKEAQSREDATWKNQMSYADAVRGRSSSKERASDLLIEDMFIWNADEALSGNQNSSEMYPKSLSFVAESVTKQNRIKTLFSHAGCSHDGKSDRGSLPEVQVTEKVSITGKGFTGSADGGKHWSKSGGFVAGDGDNKCSIYEAG
ncbi:hypothetical protein Ancab_036080 [Ancistrocladus abbreviatus]